MDESRKVVQLVGFLAGVLLAVPIIACGGELLASGLWLPVALLAAALAVVFLFPRQD